MIMIPVSAGELIDKITILSIKAERITDPDRLARVQQELGLLVAAGAAALPEPPPELPALTAELKAVNATLWQIEDEIRDCERNKDFGARFVELARAVYVTNDRRAAVKGEINRVLASEILEVKSYQAY